VYNVLGINQPVDLNLSPKILIVNHNPQVERFWLA